LSGKEKAVTHQMLHVASKQLVIFAESVGARTIVMEDLTGIRRSKTHKKQRARNHRWPFAKCQFFVGYKAAVKGISVEFVSPAFTSLTCPVCGASDKANRNGLKFLCKSCNYQDHADRIGATNVALRSLLLRQAEGERAAINPLIVVNQETISNNDLATNYVVLPRGI